MAYELRGGKRHYYHKERHGERVVSRHIGGEFAPIFDRLARHHARTQARRRSLRFPFEAADDALKRFLRRSRLLEKVLRHRAGFHEKPNGSWHRHYGADLTRYVGEREEEQARRVMGALASLLSPPPSGALAGDGQGEEDSVRYEVLDIVLRHLARQAVPAAHLPAYRAFLGRLPLRPLFAGLMAAQHDVALDIAACFGEDFTEISGRRVEAGALWLDVASDLRHFLALRQTPSCMALRRGSPDSPSLEGLATAQVRLALSWQYALEAAREGAPWLYSRRQWRALRSAAACRLERAEEHFDAVVFGQERPEIALRRAAREVLDEPAPVRYPVAWHCP